MSMKYEILNALVDYDEWLINKLNDTNGEKCNNVDGSTG